MAKARPAAPRPMTIRESVGRRRPLMTFVACPECGARPNRLCRDEDGDRLRAVHTARRQAFNERLHSCAHCNGTGEVFALGAAKRIFVPTEAPAKGGR